MNKLREAFEAWAKDKPISLELSHFAVGPDEYGSYETEIAWQAYKAAHESQQAIIDRLMLEWCPDEMSDEQMANWEAAQRVSREFP